MSPNLASQTPPDPRFPSATSHHASAGACRHHMTGLAVSPKRWSSYPRSIQYAERVALERDRGTVLAPVPSRRALGVSKGRTFGTRLFHVVTASASAGGVAVAKSSAAPPGPPPIWTVCSAAQLLLARCVVGECRRDVGGALWRFSVRRSRSWSRIVSGPHSLVLAAGGALVSHVRARGGERADRVGQGARVEPSVGRCSLEASAQRS